MRSAIPDGVTRLSDQRTYSSRRAALESADEDICEEAALTSTTDRRTTRASAPIERWPAQSEDRGGKGRQVERRDAGGLETTDRGLQDRGPTAAVSFRDGTDDESATEA